MYKTEREHQQDRKLIATVVLPSLIQITEKHDNITRADIVQEAINYADELLLQLAASQKEGTNAQQ
jgi:hypothetical protein